MHEDDRVGAGGYNPEDGEVVADDELLSGGDATAHFRPSPRPSQAARASQRVPRSFSAETSEGETLAGRYVVERVVASSTYEVVVHAQHLELGQRVVLRFLTAAAAASPDAIVRFQRGARKAREMRSEHGERVIDFGRLPNGCPYRASELPNGPSLAEIVRVRGALPVVEAADIVLMACEPVAEAHASGIIHRSLSPSNIYLERRPDGSTLVRVIDFGVTDPLEPDWAISDEVPVAAARSNSESLPYASPEQIRNPSAVDARADVWALGVILYELLAGTRLFLADSPLGMLAMISADHPAPLHSLRDDVPPDLEGLVLSCLEKDPDARPRSVVDLVLALAPFASTEAQASAARVARIVTRSTRPPAFPSSRPSFQPSQRPSALVRTRPPSRLPSQPLTLTIPDARGWGTLVAGAAIGLAVALVPVLLLRQSSPPTAAQPSTAAATATLPPTAATLALPPAPAAVPAPTQAQPAATAIAPGAASAAVAAPPPAVVPPVQATQPPAPIARWSKPRSPAPTPAKPAAKAPEQGSGSAAEQVTAAAAEPSLFGGMD
jgi:eukaryotic-like serine/threonine-protein kinase